MFLNDYFSSLSLEVSNFYYFIIIALSSRSSLKLSSSSSGIELTFDARDNDNFDLTDQAEDRMDFLYIVRGLS